MRPAEGMDPVRAQRADGGRWPLLAYTSIAVCVLLLLLQVHPWSLLGNTDYYLRNARDLAAGNLPHSRYSPGYPVVLAPLVLLTGERLSALTVAASLLSVVCAGLGLVLLFSWLRRHTDDRKAALSVSAFALGQAATSYLGRGEVESLALVLITAMLVAVSGGHHRAALGLTLAAGLVRVALVPFLGLFWLLHLRSRPRLAVPGVALAALSMLAHLAVGPIKDQSYVGIAGAIYGVGREDDVGVVQRLAEGILRRAEGYGRYGLPRLLWPHALLASGPGLVVAAVTTAAVLAGLVLLARRGWQPLAEAQDRTAAVAATAFGGHLALLLLWPVRPGETVRMVVPLVAVPLLALSVLARRVAVSPRARPAAATLLATVLALGLAASVSVVLQQRRQPADERQFTEAHETVVGKLPPGALVSRKPAFTELAVGRPTFEYPLGVRPGDLAELARRTGACIFVIDRVDSGLPEDIATWLRAHSSRIIRVGPTEFVVYDSERCRVGAEGEP